MKRARIVIVAGVAWKLAAFFLFAGLIGGHAGHSTLKARFVDASQLVKGDLVQVAGRTVGEVRRIRLADDGVAEIEMRLDDDGVQPLHAGTKATIRTVGLSGIANRYVELVPGPPSTPALPDGAVLATTSTRGVVDLDAVLASFTPQMRGAVQRIIEHAAAALTPATTRRLNRGLAYLNPASSRLAALGGDLVADQAAVESLIAHAASVATVLAAHRRAVSGGIRDSAAVLGAVASERASLTRVLERAPGTLRHTSATLRRVRTQTLPAVDPLLRAVRPVVAPLRGLLADAPPALRDARPLIAGLRALVPQARDALAPLPALRDRAVPAMRTGAAALGEVLPIVTGMRPYTPDLVAGLFVGFGGSIGQSYDANGHYIRVAPAVGPGLAAGLTPALPSSGVAGVRSGVVARCPGAAEEPAPDGSNPWVQDASCDTKDNHG